MRVAFGACPSNCVTQYFNTFCSRVLMANYKFKLPSTALEVDELLLPNLRRLFDNFSSKIFTHFQSSTFFLSRVAVPYEGILDTTVVIIEC